MAATRPHKLALMGFHPGLCCSALSPLHMSLKMKHKDVRRMKTIWEFLFEFEDPAFTGLDAHPAVRPPSTGKAAPLMKAASSLARNTNAPATSAVVAILPSGISL
jgi:hypothetical protein